MTITFHGRRITHQRLKPVNGKDAELVACGVADVGVWAATKRKHVNCPGCLAIPKE